MVGILINLTSKKNILLQSNESLSLSDKQLNWLQDHPNISYVITPHFKPVDYVNSAGEHAGYISEYIKEIERLLGVKFKFIPTSTWSETLEAVKNKKADFVSIVSRTPEREGYMQFSEPYVNFPNALFLNKDKFKTPVKLKDLNYATIALVKDYAVGEYIKTNYPLIEIVNYTTQEQCVEATSEGVVDGFIAEAAFINHTVTQKNITNLLFSGATGFTSELSLGIRNDWPILADILIAALGQIDQKKKFEFANKWYHQDEKETFWTRNFLKICLTCLAFSLVICIWHFIKSRIHKSHIEREHSILEAKSRTFASISHDIRTPLASMNGMLTLANREANPDKRKEQLTDALSSSTYLLSLINEILTFTKIDSGNITLTLEAQPLKPIIESTIGLFKNQAKSDISFISHIDLSEIPEDHKVIIDSLRVQQVIANLISNALKFTTQGSVTFNTYWIPSPQQTTFWNEDELGAFTQKNGILIAEIIDTGIGIKPEKVKTIFQAFEQADAEIEKDFGGAGLGLSICRDICQIYGGDIKVISEYKKGSTFTFAIPLETLSPC